MSKLRLGIWRSSPAPAVVLWELVGYEQRRATIALLAALIAQTIGTTLSITALDNLRYVKRPANH